MEKLLKNIFGYSSFRPLQHEIIENIMNGNDTLAIMPTGGGKSLCYQLPALKLDGLTIVISPLISLMKDQVGQLLSYGIDAVVLNSSLNRATYNNNILRLRTGEVKLLYVAPETLLLERTINILSSLNISLITVDEAHCISEWGHEFRPEYRRIVEFRKFFPSAVCAAFTATATTRVQNDIVKCLNFNQKNVFTASFNRTNLFLDVLPKASPEIQVVEFVENFQDQSGIVYCLSRKQVDKLTAFLVSNGYSAKPYHAGLTYEIRTENQEMFINDDVNIIVATIAFGMGINKPDVRFILHYDLPKNIESYYQQIGRAGRDGMHAHCRLLFSYGDLRKLRYFIDQITDKSEKSIANMHLRAMIGFAESGQCRRVPLINYFGEDYSVDNCSMCDNCMQDNDNKINITIQTQKFMSCIARTNEMFGANHIINILRGSKADKIINLGHDKLSTYEIGKDLSTKQWQHLARQLISLKHIIYDDQNGTLKLGKTTKDIFKGKLEIHGTLIEERKKKIASKQSNLDIDSNYDLLTSLKVLRKHIAEEKGIPPYAVFPDRTLLEMAAYIPKSINTLCKIHGVGRIKANIYGDEFLEVIIDFAKQNNLKENLPFSKKTVSNTNKRKFEQVGELFNSTGDLSQVSEYFNVKQTTVVDNLFKYVSSGNRLFNSKKLLNSSRVSDDLVKLTCDLFEEHGTYVLGTVYNELEKELTYEQLKLIRLYYICS